MTLNKDELSNKLKAILLLQIVIIVMISEKIFASVGATQDVFFINSFSLVNMVSILVLSLLFVMRKVKNFLSMSLPIFALLVLVLQIKFTYLKEPFIYINILVEVEVNRISIFYYIFFTFHAHQSFIFSTIP